MSGKLIYYLFVLPLSKLPLGVLYLFSDLLSFIFIHIYSYRGKVVDFNLKRSFPDKSTEEIRTIKKRFYRHFCDILIEGIKNISISEKELRKRILVNNKEIIDVLYQKNKSVLLVSGHYNNWEWLVCAQNFLFPHQAVGIGMPLSNAFWDKKLNERRARFGMRIIHAKLVKDFYKQKFEKPIATLILSDQSPPDSNKSYWMNFLNQQTAVLFGCELLAHQHNFAVVYFTMYKVKRGYYEMKFQLITEKPQLCKWGEITEKHTKLLEEAILSKPEYWMWSHKRWKREVPNDLIHLKEKQEKEFYSKFTK
ncbi:MAG: lysophospholipid acyltransferase family protein [Flavobacteriia bacterium]|nr:lysophospholipid acyltransferase family protein [Flavobacteriia bacterium]